MNTTLNPTPLIKPTIKPVAFEKIKRTGKRFVPVPDNVDETVDEYREWCIDRMDGRKIRRATVNKLYRESDYDMDDFMMALKEIIDKYTESRC